MCDDRNEPIVIPRVHNEATRSAVRLKGGREKVTDKHNIHRTRLHCPIKRLSYTAAAFDPKMLRVCSGTPLTFCQPISVHQARLPEKSKHSTN